MDEHFITRAMRKPDRRQPSTDLRPRAFIDKPREWVCNVQLPAEVAMFVMYNSENYCVVEFAGRHGIELVDKTTGRTGFLEGELEVKIRASMADFAAGVPSVEVVDEFLGHYDSLLTNSVSLH